MKTTKNKSGEDKEEIDNHEHKIRKGNNDKAWYLGVQKNRSLLYEVHQKIRL